MAAGTLRSFVCVEGPDGMVQFGPGDTVPGWAQPLITNPKAWAEEPEAQPPAPEVKAEPVLTSGQKAAATRKANAEKKAASADAGNEG